MGLEVAKHQVLTMVRLWKKRVCSWEEARSLALSGVSCFDQGVVPSVWGAHKPVAEVRTERELRTSWEIAAGVWCGTILLLTAILR